MNTNPQNFMRLTAIGLQLPVGTVLFQWDRREWSHWKVGGQGPILALLHRNLEGRLPPCPIACSTPGCM